MRETEAILREEARAEARAAQNQEVNRDMRIVEIQHVEMRNVEMQGFPEHIDL